MSSFGRACYCCLPLRRSKTSGSRVLPAGTPTRPVATPPRTVVEKVFSGRRESHPSTTPTIHQRVVSADDAVLVQPPSFPPSSFVTPAKASPTSDTEGLPSSSFLARRQSSVEVSLLTSGRRPRRRTGEASDGAVTDGVDVRESQEPLSYIQSTSMSVRERSKRAQASMTQKWVRARRKLKLTLRAAKSFSNAVKCRICEQVRIRTSGSSCLVAVTIAVAVISVVVVALPFCFFLGLFVCFSFEIFSRISMYYG